MEEYSAMADKRSCVHRYMMSSIRYRSCMNKYNRSYQKYIQLKKYSFYYLPWNVFKHTLLKRTLIIFISMCTCISAFFPNDKHIVQSHWNKVNLRAIPYKGFSSLNECHIYVYLPGQKIQSPSLLQFYLLPTCRPRTVQSVRASFPVVKRK